ncbi:MAG: hypothetical protein P8J37_00920 [Fuerstiella sp.]|nr:hypothetical protein [Fuerstiella sp.]
MISRLFSLCLLPCMVLSATADERTDSDPQQPAGSDFFETKIRPALVKHCYECHSVAKAEGGLRVDFRTLIRQGGDRGAAIVPERPEASVLLTAIRTLTRILRCRQSERNFPIPVSRTSESGLKPGLPIHAVMLMRV